MKSAFDYHPRAAGEYVGHQVEMHGQFLPGRGFIIDVFFDGERAANFSFF
jgi:hypothetical protein